VAALLLAVLALLMAACGTSLTDAEVTAAGGIDPKDVPEEAAEGDRGSVGVISGTEEVIGDPTDDSTAGAGGTRSGAGPATGPVAAGRATGGSSVIKLGSIGTMSGPIGGILAAAPVGIRAWVASVNADGGLNGHPVDVLVADDGGDPGKALALARRMVEQDGVLAFFGMFGAATMHAITPYLEEQNIPVIGSVPHPSIETSPVFFYPNTANLYVNQGNVVALVQASSARKVALLACGEADACPKAIADMKAVAPRLGVEVVYEARYSLAQPDFTAEVLGARNAGAEAVILVGDTASVSRFLRSADRQGWHPVMVAPSSIYNQVFVDAAGSLAEGVITFGTTAPYSTSGLMAPYREAVARYVPGGALGDYGANMWVGGKLLERVAPSFGATVTRADIFTAMRALRDETLGGLTAPFSFPARPTAPGNRCIWPLRVAGGTWVAPQGDSPSCA
jgi:branched-chain amino acid transport system substrate-binding protein